MTRKLLSLILIAAGAAHGAAWIEIGREQSAVVLLDTQSVVEEGKYRKARFNWAYEVDQPVARGKTYRNNKTLTYFNCAARTSYDTETVGYTAGGEVVWKQSYDIVDAAFSEPVADSVAATMLKTVCDSKGR